MCTCVCMDVCVCVSVCGVNTCWVRLLDKSHVALAQRQQLLTWNRRETENLLTPDEWEKVEHARTQTHKRDTHSLFRAFGRAGPYFE